MFIDFTKPDFLNGISPSATWELQIIDFIKKWQDEEVFEIQTSGSTGTPKKIKCHKKAMVASANMTGKYFNFKSGQTALLCLPTDKISGIMMLVRAMVWKLKLYCTAPKMALNLRQFPPLDFAAMLPAQALYNISELDGIKKLLLGGAAIPIHLNDKLKTLPTQSYLSYGMTETLSHIAIQRLGTTNYFETLEGIRISKSEKDCLVIDAPQLGIETLHTNDIIALISNHKFQYLGRYDNVINSGGLKIIPETIEQQIMPLFEQVLFYIGLMPHPVWGEQITLFIEGKPWKKEALKQLQKHLKRITPKQAIPQQIIFKNQFEKTANGKIIR